LKPTTSGSFNRIFPSTPAPSKTDLNPDGDEDYEDENQIWFERKPSETASPKPKSHPSAIGHPKLATILTTTSTMRTTTSPAARTTTRKSDGSRIIHPHANSGGRTTTEKSRDVDVDADLKDLISQVGNLGFIKKRFKSIEFVEYFNIKLGYM
jgi:hypothetical protein